MRHDISEYVNQKNPLYIEGCLAIKRRDDERLSVVLKNENFDCQSFEALGLLFIAAENAYIKGFQMLGDIGVCMSQPLKVLSRRDYIFAAHPLQPVLLTYDKTPLHVLIENSNIEALKSLDLENHFKETDIQRTLNTYALGIGTPLQVAYEKHLAANRYLKEHHIKEMSVSFLKFYLQMMPFYPNVQAPLIAEDEMLFQKAIRLNDMDTLSIISPHTINFLNIWDYEYTKKEYEILHRFDLPQEWKDEMKKSTNEPVTIKKATVSDSIKRLLHLFKKDHQNG